MSVENHGLCRCGQDKTVCIDCWDEEITRLQQQRDRAEELLREMMSHTSVNEHGQGISPKMFLTLPKVRAYLKKREGRNETVSKILNAHEKAKDSKLQFGVEREEE